MINARARQGTSQIGNVLPNEKTFFPFPFEFVATKSQDRHELEIQSLDILFPFESPFKRKSSGVAEFDWYRRVLKLDGLALTGTAGSTRDSKQRLRIVI